jgi:putative membrane protein
MNNVRKLTIIASSLLLSCSALAADTNKEDAEYLQKTAQGTMAEVKMGEMAQKQAADERVKQFGKRMVDDHGKDLENLRQLASQKEVALPDAPSKKQRKEIDKLAALSGADFDKEYVKYEVKDHKDDVEENGKTMKKAVDPDVRKFAGAEYQTVLAHQKEIDALHRQLGK